MATPKRTQAHLFWRLQIGGWLLLVPVSVSMALVLFRDPGTVALIGVGRQLLGFGITLGFWRIYQRWPAADFKIRPHTGAIALVCFGGTALDVLVTELCRRTLHLTPPPFLAEQGGWLIRFAIYVAWSAFYFIIRQELAAHTTALRLAQAEAANREAELQMLRAQVNPHFLFNALNSIIGEAEHNPSAVIATTHAVADYLRYSLNHGAHLAPLGEELEAMANYLRIERASRGAARFDWQIEATGEARAATAPTALVQPLIENAIKYGLRTSPAPLQLRVEARVEINELVVAVENTGTWITRQPGAERRDSTGIGLSNLRRRLALLCGDSARLDVFPADQHVRIEIRLPFPLAALSAVPAGR